VVAGVCRTGHNYAGNVLQSCRGLASGPDRPNQAAIVKIRPAGTSEGDLSAREQTEASRSALNHVD